MSFETLELILDTIMLITGVQSVVEPRGELLAPNCEILKHFRDFSEDLSVSQSISRDFRMPGSIVCSRGRAKNLMTPRERARQKV